MSKNKPMKRSTQELFYAIKFAIQNGEYYFTDHAEKRSLSRRKVTDEEVIRILEGRDKWHEKSKDKFEKVENDWNYHIRGRNTDWERVRIVISFYKNSMVIITVINLDED